MIKSDFWSPRIITQKLEQVPTQKERKKDATHNNHSSSQRYLTTFNADVPENKTEQDPNDRFLDIKSNTDGKEIRIEVNNSPNKKEEGKSGA